MALPEEKDAVLGSSEQKKHVAWPPRLCQLWDVQYTKGHQGTFILMSPSRNRWRATEEHCMQQGGSDGTSQEAKLHSHLNSNLFQKKQHSHSYFASGRVEQRGGSHLSGQSTATRISTSQKQNCTATFVVRQQGGIPRGRGRTGGWFCREAHAWEKGIVSAPWRPADCPAVERDVGGF